MELIAELFALFIISNLESSGAASSTFGRQSRQDEEDEDLKVHTMRFRQILRDSTAYRFRCEAISKDDEYPTDVHREERLFDAPDVQLRPYLRWRPEAHRCGMDAIGTARQLPVQNAALHKIGIHHLIPRIEPDAKLVARWKATKDVARLGTVFGFLLAEAEVISYKIDVKQRILIPMHVLIDF